VPEREQAFTKVRRNRKSRGLGPWTRIRTAEEDFSQGRGGTGSRRGNEFCRIVLSEFWNEVGEKGVSGEPRSPGTCWERDASMSARAANEF